MLVYEPTDTRAIKADFDAQVASTDTLQMIMRAVGELGALVALNESAISANADNAKVKDGVK